MMGSSDVSQPGGSSSSSSSIDTVSFFFFVWQHHRCRDDCGRGRLPPEGHFSAEFHSCRGRGQLVVPSSPGTHLSFLPARRLCFTEYIFMSSFLAQRDKDRTQVHYSSRHCSVLALAVIESRLVRLDTILHSYGIDSSRGEGRRSDDSAHFSTLSDL